MNQFSAALILSVFLASAAITAPVFAQADGNPATTGADGQPAEEDESEPEEDPGIPADFNEYIRKLYPSIDPGGEHDLFNLKSYTDKDKRFNYTTAMAQLILTYMQNLQMGSTVSKLFDQYSRGKEGNQPTFKVLHAIVMLYYPPGQPNVIQAQKLLREASEKAPDYAYPWFVLAQFEFARFVGSLRAGGEVSPRETLAALDKALEIRPTFVRAIVTKGQVYMQAKPPRTVDVARMIEPWMTADKLPQDVEEFEDMLRLYVASHKAEEFFDLTKQLADSKKLSARQRGSMEQFAGEVAIQLQKIDEAIGRFEVVLKFVPPELDPGAAMRAHRSLAICWNSKAQDVLKSDEQLENPANKKKFDELVEEVTSHNLACANIETKNLPLNLRGSAAMQYAQYLWRGVGRAEEALKWLEAYLSDTDLTGAQRNVLENLREIIRFELNPTEDGLIDRYESQLKRDDVEGLAKSLAMIWEMNLVKGEHFKSQRALDFFVSQLDSRSRIVVHFSALLAADTVAQIGGDRVASTGKAIADRFEQETEMNSEQQAKLQENLCLAIRLTADRPSQERAVRHLVTLIKASRDNIDISTLMRGAVNVWTDEEYLEEFTPALDKPSRTKTYRANGAIEWLSDHADSIKEQAVKDQAAREKEAKEKEAKEKEAKEKADAEKKAKEENSGESSDK